MVVPARLPSPLRPRSSSGPSLGLVAAGELTLSRGSNGDGVKALQSALNAAGMDPPLAVDGRFGPKTERAVRAFQLELGCPNTGRADARLLDKLLIKSPSAPETPAPKPADSDAPRRAPMYGSNAPEGSVPARVLIQNNPSTGPVERAKDGAPAGSVADRIVSEAKADDGKIANTAYDGAEYKNWRYLQDTLEKATTGPIGADGKHHPPGDHRADEDVRTHPQPIWRDKDGEIHKTSWCGIWATRMYQRAGVDCYWKPNEGLKGDVDKVMNPKREEVRAGDIIVGGPPKWHHAIVTGIERDASGRPISFETMNGNMPGIGPGRMQAAAVTALYRPKPH